jgi:WD40 repeat protein
MRIPETEYDGDKFVVYDQQGDRFVTRALDDESVILLIQLQWNRPDPIRCQASSGVVNTAQFLSSEQFVSGGSDGMVRFWNSNSGALLDQMQVGGAITSLHSNTEGTKLLIGRSGGKVELYDVPSRRLESTYDGVSNVQSVAMSADNRWIAAGGGIYGQPGELVIWNVGKPKPVHALIAHRNVVADIKFHPDSRRLFSGSYDRTIRIWDVPRGLEMLNLRGHGREVTALDLTSDGNILASADRLGQVELWDATPIGVTEPEGGYETNSGK